MIETTNTYVQNQPAYDVIGPAAGRPILLVHGSTVTRRSWILQEEGLKMSFRLIVPDLPGHGVQASQPFDFDSAVDSLYEIVLRETHSRVLVAGVSLGGYVAVVFASRYPDLVAGLAVSGASGDIRGPVGAWMRLVGRALPRFFKEDRLRANLEKSLRKKWPPSVAEAQIADGLFPKGAAESFIQAPRYDYRELVARIPAPILVLNGEKDRANRRGEAAFAAAAQNGRVEMVSGAGHACNIENAPEYNRKLVGFAGDINW